MKHDSDDNLERMLGPLGDALDALPSIADHVRARLAVMGPPGRTRRPWYIPAGLAGAAAAALAIALCLPRQEPALDVDTDSHLPAARVQWAGVDLEQRFSLAIEDRAVLVASIVPAGRDVSWVWPGDRSTWREHLLWRSSPQSGRQCLVHLLVGDEAANPYAMPPQAGVRFDSLHVSALGVTPLPGPPQAIRDALRQVRDDWPGGGSQPPTYAKIQYVLQGTE